MHSGPRPSVEVFSSQITRCHWLMSFVYKCNTMLLVTWRYSRFRSWHTWMAIRRRLTLSYSTAAVTVLIMHSSVRSVFYNTCDSIVFLGGCWTRVAWTRPVYPNYISTDPLTNSFLVYIVFLCYAPWMRTRPMHLYICIPHLFRCFMPSRLSIQVVSHSTGSVGLVSCRCAISWTMVPTANINQARHFIILCK